MMNTAFVPPGLARSAVYRKVPLGVRCRLDRLILLRPKGCATDEAIAKRLMLTERYGVSVTALKRYARQLEELVRPMVSSQLIAAIMGCLPPEFRRSVTDGSQVLLLGKVVQALNGLDDNGDKMPNRTLSVADLAKLATVLRAIRPPKARLDGGGEMPNAGELDERQGDNPNTLRGDSGVLAATVRTAYGLSWPLPTDESQQGGSEPGEPEQDTLAG